MTIGVGRRALLQAGAAIIGGAAMPTTILADSLAEADGCPHHGVQSYLAEQLRKSL
jgi:hypothetical protein